MSKADLSLAGGNPLIPGIGLTDPHGFISDGRVFLFATHDCSALSIDYIMKDWWVWSSCDLREWKLESILKPVDTYLGKPFNDCWAGFGVQRNGRWYWYFSAGPKNIGVVTADSPGGPWSDPLGIPLMGEGMISTDQRDPDILLDDDGEAYMVFGTFNYYMVRLGRDMLSMAEAPRPVIILNPQGPYGAGRTDDKPSLHKRNDLYYLSWSSYYATAHSVYGPYEYRGCIIDSTSLSPQFQHPSPTFDRHGNFFQLNGQTYFTCNDASQAGCSRYFRDSILAYVHYRDDGTMAPIRIEPVGVGQYDAASGPIQAANYFLLVGGVKRESPEGWFEVQALANGSEIRYPHIKNIRGRVRLTLFFRSSGVIGGWVEARSKTGGAVLATMAIEPASDWNILRDVSCEFSVESGELELLLAFKGPDREFCRLCRFTIVSV